MMASVSQLHPIAKFRVFWIALIQTLQKPLVAGCQLQLNLHSISLTWEFLDHSSITEQTEGHNAILYCLDQQVHSKAVNRGWKRGCMWGCRILLMVSVARTCVLLWAFMLTVIFCFIRWFRLTLGSTQGGWLRKGRGNFIKPFFKYSLFLFRWKCSSSLYKCSKSKEKLSNLSGIKTWVCISKNRIATNSWPLRFSGCFP